MKAYKVTFESGWTMMQRGGSPEDAMLRAEAEQNLPIWVGGDASNRRAAEDGIFTAAGGYLVKNDAHLSRAISATPMSDVFMGGGWCLIPDEREALGCPSPRAERSR